MSNTETPDNVIELSRTNAQVEQQAQQPERRTGCSPEKMREIIGAYKRLKEIGSSKIINPTAEAEQRGLVQYLHRELLENAEELFGAWVVIRQEYEPLITGVANLLARASARFPGQQ